MPIYEELLETLYTQDRPARTATIKSERMVLYVTKTKKEIFVCKPMSGHSFNSSVRGLEITKHKDFQIARHAKGYTYQEY